MKYKLKTEKSGILFWFKQKWRIPDHSSLNLTLLAEGLLKIPFAALCGRQKTANLLQIDDRPKVLTSAV